MPITEWMERLGRTIFEAPFGCGSGVADIPEVAEIRLAVLDEVKARSHRVGGRLVFPHNEVRVSIRGVPPDQAGTFASPFFAEFCAEELRRGLARSNYRYPADLEVHIATSPDLPLAGEHWLSVEVASRPASAEAPKRPAKLVIVKGAANHAEVALTKARTNLGRTVDVYRSNGPSRRNDLAFLEADETSRTVSREHAHIAYSRKSGEYRLFNDRSYKDGSCGLWLIRDGLSLEVHRGPRGVRLEPGDEIHLGRAVVRFARRT
jgi:hypothetical protein